MKRVHQSSTNDISYKFSHNSRITFLTDLKKKKEKKKTSLLKLLIFIFFFFLISLKKSLKFQHIPEAIIIYSKSKDRLAMINCKIN